MTTRHAIAATALKVHRFFGPPGDPFEFDDQVSSKSSFETPGEKKEDKPKEDKPKADKPKGTPVLTLKDDKPKEDKPPEEDEEEEEEEEEEEHEPDPLDEKKKQEEEKQKKKEESIKNLREQRDAARKEREAFGNLTPELAKEVTTFLEERFKDKIPSPEELRGELLLVADKDKKLSELEAALTERDAKLADIDIRTSPEFKKSYSDPYQNAKETLFLEIAQLDGNGKALAHDLTSRFWNDMLQQEKADGVAIKQALAKFARDFKTETGEDYQMPSVSNLVTSLRGAIEKRDALNEAYKGWGEKKAQTVVERQRQEERDRADILARNERTRRAQAQDALRSYDRTQVEGIFTDEDVAASWNEEYQFLEGIMKDPTNSPPFKELVERGWKARNFDKVAKELKELKAWKAEQDKKRSSKSRGGGGDPRGESDKEDDPLASLNR